MKYEIRLEARSRGLVVRAEDSRTLNQEDVGSIPTVYWMDVSVASYYIERKDNKGSQMGHTKKIFKKTLLIKFYCQI